MLKQQAEIAERIHYHTPRATVAERIAEAVRADIRSGRLNPGEHLRQEVLTAAYGASRVPIREALMQLNVEGLLQHDPHRGYFVKNFSRFEAQQIYRMRRWIETELLGSLNWPGEALLDQFAALQAVVEAPAREAFRTWYAALVRLRTLLFGLSPDAVLLHEASRLWARTDQLHAFLRPEGSYSFVTALAARDRHALLATHSAERDCVEQELLEAEVALPGWWGADH